MVDRLFLAVPLGCLQFVIVVFPDHTHLLFLNGRGYAKSNINVAIRLQVLPQNIPLPWEPIDHKHIVSIPELLRCHTIIMVNFN